MGRKLRDFRGESSTARVLARAILPTYRLGKQTLLKARRVRLPWLLELGAWNAFSTRRRVGFFPIKTGEHTLGHRKYRVDPIVNCLNRRSRKYVADICCTPQELCRFDIVVVVAYFESVNVAALKEANTIVVFDIVDRSSVLIDGDVFSLHDRKDRGPSDNVYTRFLAAVDGVILSSPLQIEDVRPYNTRLRLIEHPIINKRHKTDYCGQGRTRLIWLGYRSNLWPMYRLRPVLRELERAGVRIELVLCTDVGPDDRDDEVIKFRQWRIRDWEAALLEADVGVSVKPLGCELQQRKPATKIVSYMAAGLPVVCTPSVADTAVIEHGRTGFIAYTDEQWYEYLKRLSEDVELRARMGRAAREAVWERFSVERIGTEYEALFDGLQRPSGGFPNVVAACRSS
ncbi:MAG: glycosyltransferase [Gemmatimonadota bacterium]